VQDIFEENGSKMLQGAIIWTPMLASDSLNAAEGREVMFSDSRVKHYWDPGRILGQMLSRILHLKAPVAWDVYLVYPREHHWDKVLPPAPKLWMHQLNEQPILLLDPLRLKCAVQEMVEGAKYQ